MTARSPPKARTASLLASSPIYREIYESQLGNGRVNHGCVELRPAPTMPGRPQALVVPEARRRPGRLDGRPIERAKNRRGTLLRLWGYLRRQKWGLAAVLLLVVLASGLDLAGPYLMGSGHRRVHPQGRPARPGAPGAADVRRLPGRCTGGLAARLRDGRRGAAHRARPPQRPVRQASRPCPCATSTSARTAS